MLKGGSFVVLLIISGFHWDGRRTGVGVKIDMIKWMCFVFNGIVI